MEKHNIKATVTAQGFNNLPEAQKVRYLIKRIDTNLMDNCLTNISRSASLCDDVSAAARHVDDFLVIINSRDPVRSRNILGVDTDRGGGGRPGAWRRTWTRRTS